MNGHEFVLGIKKLVLESGQNDYETLFNTTSIDNATDPYWIEALTFFNSLSQEEQKILFKIIYQISIDTISSMFAILDGVTRMDNQNSGFVLTLEGDADRPINGALQDIFLGSIEDKQ